MTTDTAEALAAALTGALPEDQVLRGADAAPYAVHGVAPAAVAAPGSVEELAAVMRAAHARRAAVVPWGGGTQQLIGAPPRRADLVIRTERLNRVLMHEPEDLTISVEAGMTLGALRAHLARHGQALPLDPPLPDRATIGGLIATAADGPRRLGYGTLRDLLIGISVVDAAGRVTKAGGMVVKNVSGFDMMKLYHGSFGTLALIVSANFKLLPAPRTDGTLLCRFAAPDAAIAFLDALHDSQLTPAAVEYLNGRALVALGLDGECAVAVRAEGLADAVERHLRDVRRLALDQRAEVAEPDDAADLWRRIADLPQTTDVAADEAVIKLAVLPSALGAALGELERIAAEDGARAAISARALNGVIYARLSGVSAGVLRAVAAAPLGFQWSATPLADAPRWGDPRGLDLMRRMKDEFDPAGTLNPGRYVAGL